MIAKIDYSIRFIIQIQMIYILKWSNRHISPSLVHSCSELVLTGKKCPHNLENKFIKYSPQTILSLDLWGIFPPIHYTCLGQLWNVVLSSYFIPLYFTPSLTPGLFFLQDQKPLMLRETLMNSTGPSKEKSRGCRKDGVTSFHRRIDGRGGSTRFCLR